MLDLPDSGIPQGIEKYIHLRWLNLSYNGSFSIFEVLDTICSELYNLQTLLLSNCNLQEIPRGIGNLINLRHLDLSENESLKELPREIGNLINLRHLDLNSNESLEELPREIGNLINLRHLDLNNNESLEELPREIGNLINLRYLDLSSNGSLKELPREMWSLVNLRHLDLSYNTSLKELPREMENLINLRHLDLSSNGSLKELPESICGLRELKTLNITLCDRISSLPQGIHRLVNLKHLHTDSIMQFPQGLAHLTCLHTLSEFWVGKNVGKLGWLKNLNRLSGSLILRISLNGGLENTDVEDAREGELRNKEYLQELDITFYEDIDEVEDCVRMGVIDALQPHPNLQKLSIWNFKGSRLPGWIASPINQVKNIRLINFDHLSSLAPLGILPFLEEIDIFFIHEMRFVGCEFLGITTTSESGHTNSITDVYFHKLKKLALMNCSKWEEWEDITVQQEDEKVSFMPHLTSLSIKGCDRLAALPHRLLRKAAALEKLDISGSTQLEQCYGDQEGSPWKSISNINPRIQLTMSD
ncbi:putative disease resistance rpp13-like protein 1 [Phtheirospermum japonicum]|uniref:Putative disease resistance rpp13-like protein 1 n=1 Tax=Phtheirospermum japonicum TaxID=374723 RepID=A0A830C4R6_9LAMI|nr:putative disease resistance rpp13-like protein 1 [Phtheirospermum japonicum]